MPGWLFETILEVSVKPRTLVIDYGVGNLLSVCRALDACGAEVNLDGTAASIRAADRIVVPGVGAFGDCMHELRRYQLIAPIREFIASGRPVLGICVGMQMMLEIGEEFGEHDGLGLVPGRVRAIPSTSSEGEPHKIPHIGWNALVKPKGVDWKGTILDGIPEGATCYFVHSFTAEPANDRFRLADCFYNGRRISAALRVGNVCGTQFHPEKSGKNGLRVLTNFLTLKADSGIAYAQAGDEA